MDIPYYILGVEYSSARDPVVIDKSVESGFGNDLCTLVRMTVYPVEADLVLVPTAITLLIHSCDGLQIGLQIVSVNEKWKNVSQLGLDTPYVLDPENSEGAKRHIEYYAGQIRRMIAFLGTHTTTCMPFYRNRKHEVMYGLSADSL